ncbi:MAG: S8 family serine peptidase [Bdellovibrionaceae bacterium]|nr:S8 family serine peptidase [Pseudobdellovibrionaceae bacterium]
MDVTMRLFIATVITICISACSDKGSNTDQVNKSSDPGCTNLAVKNENILRWKNGKISRLLFRNQEARAAYLKKHEDSITAVEDNFRIQKPKPMALELSGFTGDLNWGMKTINAEPLWNKNILGNGVVVAIIDSGVDSRHVQLHDQMYSNPGEIANGLDDDQNGLVDDIHGYDFISQSGNLSDNSGHGTHIAGVIAADHSQGQVTGVAPQSKLLVYDFFGTNEDGTVFDAIRAIRVASQVGAKVINASWGGPGCSTALKLEIESLAAKDVLFITAAGNEGQNIDQTPSYPAAFSGVTQITVGAMTLDEYTAGFSNYGSKVDLVAPGVNIISTFPVLIANNGQQTNRYENMAGTSMATPFVVGSAALLWSAFPQAKALDIKRALLESTRSGFYPVKTRGSLDVAAAHAVLEKQFPPAPLP